ncbi:MAG: type II toxin-antitoxin system Phd/YefM family antitoxin [Lentisphaerae bacterium]|nr:type II toxin-antitoxin system Phd/YefM family antitoxin [Lentisphaerota bacterium]
MTTHTMTEAKNDICALIREAEKDAVVVTRHGKPAAVIIGFADDDAWFDYRLEHDETFLRKIARARDQIKRGKFVPLDKLPD